MAKQETSIADEGWVDVEDPDFFKFDNVGDEVVGKLVDVGVSDQYKFGLYTVEQPDGSLLRFHGSAHLDSRMKQIQIGETILVKFMDLEKRPKGDMKLFDVKRKPTKE